MFFSSSGRLVFRPTKVWFFHSCFCDTFTLSVSLCLWVYLQDVQAGKLHHGMSVRNISRSKLTEQIIIIIREYLETWVF